MKPHVCEEWEYKDVPNYGPVLDQRVKSLLEPIFQPGFPTASKAGDTRKSHKALFKNLTPALYPHFAGNYRGAPKDCLDHRMVGVGGDKRVGSAPELVAGEMEELRESIFQGLAALDTQLPSLTRGEFLTHAIQFGCEIFQVFLRIHPYANGNGHVARYILWIILARYNFKFQKFAVEPSPFPPGPYVAAIKAHRDGHPEVLENYVLDCLDPN